MHIMRKFGPKVCIFLAWEQDEMCHVMPCLLGAGRNTATGRCDPSLRSSADKRMLCEWDTSAFSVLSLCRIAPHCTAWHLVRRELRSWGTKGFCQGAALEWFQALATLVQHGDQVTNIHFNTNFGEISIFSTVYQNEICTVFCQMGDILFFRSVRSWVRFPRHVHPSTMHSQVHAKEILLFWEFAKQEHARVQRSVETQREWNHTVFLENVFFSSSETDMKSETNLSIDRSIYLSIYLSMYLSIYLSIHPSIHPSIFNLYMSLHLSLDLHVFKPVYLDLPIFSIRSSSASTVDHPRS